MIYLIRPTSSAVTMDLPPVGRPIGYITLRPEQPHRRWDCPRPAYPTMEEMFSSKNLARLRTFIRPKSDARPPQNRYA